MQTHQEEVRSGEREGQQRGTKRPADDSLLNDDQRFTKRFNLLNIGGVPNTNGNSSAYYIPVRSPQATTPATEATARVTQQDEELMQVDETRDRVYVHNLDEELADIEASEEREKLIFLPDIEKKLSKIPNHVLRGNSAVDGDHEDQQLVLYKVPKSLTTDEGSSSVMRAILESRQRAREKALQEARQEDMERKYEQGDLEQGTETAHGYGSGYSGEVDPDPDAMDIG